MSLLTDAAAWQKTRIEGGKATSGRQPTPYAAYHSLAETLHLQGIGKHPRRMSVLDITRFLLSHKTEGPKLVAAGVTQKALYAALARHLRRTKSRYAKASRSAAGDYANTNNAAPPIG